MFPRIHSLSNPTIPLCLMLLLLFFILSRIISLVTPSIGNSLRDKSATGLLHLPGPALLQIHPPGLLSCCTGAVEISLYIFFRSKQCLCSSDQSPQFFRVMRIVINKNKVLGFDDILKPSFHTPE